MSGIQYQVVDVSSAGRKSPEFFQACLHRVRQHRLEALKNDPEAYTSNYEYESQQDVDFFEQRMLNKEARQLVILRSESGHAASDILREPWLGSLILLGPRHFHEDFDSEHTWKSFINGSPKPASNNASSQAMYLIVAMYVSPDCRRQSLGGRLLQVALKMIKMEVSSLSLDRSICIVMALQLNLRAQGLYTKAGFKTVAQCTDQRRDGQEVVEFVLRQDLTREQNPVRLALTNVPA